MTSKKSEGPLLYIHQPFTRPPSVKMQEVFKDKKETELTGEEKNPIRDEEKFSGKVEASIEFPKTEKPEQSASFNRVKSFKEMDVKERLEYLIDFPKVLPPVPCVFYTADHNYQGYLINHNGDQITIEFHDKTTKDLPVTELTDVIMIGIRK